MNVDRIVSIVVPTFNRFERLRRCIEAIRATVERPREILIVDGGSTDGTREWLARQADLRFIAEERREGAVKAFNKGFRAATGFYIMWLNDDAYLLPGAVQAAVDLLERPDLSDVGMVAFYHNWHSDRNVLDRVRRGESTFELCHVRGYPYANFGLLRRSLLEKVGFADERFFFFGFDPDLALNIQLNEGLRVVGCREALIEHDQRHDERKRVDLAAGRDDNERLFAKWNLPDPGEYPDPRPGYLKMLEQGRLL